MDVFESVYEYYEKEIDWEPDVKRQWVEGYLRELVTQKASDHKLQAALDTICMFMDYQERSEHRDLGKIPFWEYSVCLHWLVGHRGFHLSLRSAERFLAELLDFYEYLERNGHINGKEELGKALEGMCSRGRLRVVDRIPYAGDEFWTAVYPGRGSETSFTIKDFWLALLHAENGSWRRLKEEARKACQPEQMLALIESFHERLKTVGYATPQKLFREDPTYEDLADARRWFYRGKTPAVKWITP